MKKIFSGFSIALLLITLIIGGYFATIFVPSEWYKVTDPTNPDFNPDNFSYRDYRNQPMELREAFRVMFPQGTPKEYVDRILVDKAGFTELFVGEVEEYYLVGYGFPSKYFWKGSPTFTAIYNKNYEIIQINQPAGLPLYEADVTVDELKQKRIENYRKRYENVE